MAELTRRDWQTAIQGAQAKLRESIGQTLAQAKERLGGFADRKLEAVKEHKDELVGQAIRSAEIQAAAFAMGMARGRLGDERMTLLGMPAEGVVGLVAHAVAFGLLPGSEYAPYVHALADGVIAAWASQEGRELGMRQRARSAPAAAAGYAPYVPAPYAVLPPPSYAPYALPAVAGYAPPAAQAGASPAGAADRAMAQAIAVMQQEQLNNDGEQR